MPQIPSVGRIIHYFPNGKDESAKMLAQDKCPAIIIHTAPDGEYVNLYIFSSTIEAEGTTPIRFAVPHKDLNQKGPYWDWPEMPPVMHIAHSQGVKPITDGNSGDMGSVSMSTTGSRA